MVFEHAYAVHLEWASQYVCGLVWPCVQEPAGVAGVVCQSSSTEWH